MKTKLNLILVMLALLGSSVFPLAGTEDAAQAEALQAYAAGEQAHALAPDDDVTGPQKVLVLRVYFADYSATSRYTKAEVEGFFDELDTLWQNISYGKISINAQVSDLFQLPDNRSAYIDDGVPDGAPPCDPTSQGDLSCGSKFTKVLQDSIASAPDGLDWEGLDAVMVVMAETDPTQFHRGQELGPCKLPKGPDSDDEMTVGCPIFSENPTESDLQVWGRWAHEIGHAFQQSGPAHPSNYNSEFELMDANYPGQSGVFSKQEHTAFPGWLPTIKYQVFTPTCSVGPSPCTGQGGGTATVWAMEYNPADKPNIQAVKAYITDDLYYLISVRRRVNGDELNGDFANGIPDEGVLIERVEEGASQWVTVQGKGGDRNDLWDSGDTFSNTSDGIQIFIPSKIDDDNYLIYVTYDMNSALQPDVMIYPWTSPPGDTWETTDIWIDSPVNGFDTYTYGFWDDLSGNPVPVGNGDIPVVGMVNRLYARVRNVGGAAAKNVKVHFEITDPPGMGINDETSFKLLGTVTSADFTGLNSIAAGDYVDVYYEWTPDYDFDEADLENGNFLFHTCLRVRIDPVEGETVFGNQDGDREQENVFYFHAPDDGAGATYDAKIHLHNDDPFESRFFYLHYDSDLPQGWQVEINQGNLDVEVSPNSVMEVPIQLIAPSVITATPGTAYGVDVTATSLKTLVSDLDPNDTHAENEILGGVRLETRVEKQTSLDCEIKQASDGSITIVCNLDGIGPFVNPNLPLRILVAGATRDPFGKLVFLSEASILLPVNAQGQASGTLTGEAFEQADSIIVMFAGTAELSPAGTSLPLNTRLYLPLMVR